MPKTKPKPYPPYLLELMAAKTAVLMKARTFAEMGMAETAQPMWAVAASHEQQIAPHLDVLARPLEAAASRISAASCCQKAGDMTGAANLYQAALAAPLRPKTRRDVEAMLADCLEKLTLPASKPLARRKRKVPAAT